MRKSKAPDSRSPRELPSGRDPDASGVRLLSGGNPQIAKGDGDEVVRSYIAAMPGWKQDVGRRLDELIARLVPGVRRAVRWNTPFYGVEGQGWFLAFHCFTGYVKVTFFRGSELSPLPPISSRQPLVRYLHLHAGEEPDDPAIIEWIRQASARPGEPLF